MNFSEQFFIEEQNSLQFEFLALPQEPYIAQDSTKLEKQTVQFSFEEQNSLQFEFTPLPQEPQIPQKLNKSEKLNIKLKRDLRKQKLRIQQKQLSYTKEEQRKINNRISAQKSRDIKKNLIEQLKEENKYLKEQLENKEQIIKNLQEQLDILRPVEDDRQSQYSTTISNRKNLLLFSFLSIVCFICFIHVQELTSTNMNEKQDQFLTTVNLNYSYQEEQQKVQMLFLKQQEQVSQSQEQKQNQQETIQFNEQLEADDDNSKSIKLKQQKRSSSIHSQSLQSGNSVENQIIPDYTIGNCDYLIKGQLNFRIKIEQESKLKQFLSLSCSYYQHQKCAQMINYAISREIVYGKEKTKAKTKFASSDQLRITLIQIVQNQQEDQDNSTLKLVDCLQDRTCQFELQRELRNEAIEDL